MPDVSTPPRECVRGTRPAFEALREATLSRTYVSMGTRRTNSPHEFYRYPARFSPAFAAAAINAFSGPDDVILDPFVGGGTTAVEATRLGRQAVVSDLNSLATFITRAKVTPLDRNEVEAVRRWLFTVGRLRTNQPVSTSYSAWEEAGYFKGLRSADTWRLRHVTALAIQALPRRSEAAARFCRCVLLRSAQWALDMRSDVPSLGEYRSALVRNGTDMLAVLTTWHASLPSGWRRPVVLDCGVPGLEEALRDRKHAHPRLILTSPPYPGVYVNYHRWKLRGRREIPAPYWIAGREDGHGLAHYTMSARAEPTLDVYFSRLREAFVELASIAAPDSSLVQLVGFSDSGDQFERYLAVMNDVGFEEFMSETLATADDGRLWRSVPNRRWWTEAASRRGVAPHTSREVVLLHRPKR